MCCPVVTCGGLPVWFHITVVNPFTQYYLTAEDKEELFCCCVQEDGSLEVCVGHPAVSAQAWLQLMLAAILIDMVTRVALCSARLPWF